MIANNPSAGKEGALGRREGNGSAVTDDSATTGSTGNEAEDLRLLAANAHDFAMIFTDEERHVLRWSDGAEHLLGWTEEEAIRANEIDLIFTPEDKAAGIPQQEQDTALREGRAEDERWHMKKDGSRFFASGVMTPIYDPSTGVLRGFGKVMRDMTERKRLEEELKCAKETLEARVAERTAALAGALSSLEALLAEREGMFAEREVLLQKVVLAQEEERRRISRELHDQTGQHLTALSLGLKTLEDATLSSCLPGSDVPALLERMRAITQEMAQDVHRIAVDLRPPALDDLGLPSALRHYVEEWSQRSGIDAEFQTSGFDAERRLPSLVEATVYRVVQEALTNVARHANETATRVSVALQRVEGNLQAIVEDNGPGFDVQEGAQSGRLGMGGMWERAASCGGALEVESAPGEGTSVFLRIPIPQEQEP